MIDSPFKQDVFRQEYSPLSPEANAAVLAVKAKYQELYDLINNSAVPGNDMRCLAVAKTELESSAMWAIKGLTAPVLANAPSQGIGAGPIVHG